jgi:hypothetical protein
MHSSSYKTVLLLSHGRTCSLFTSIPHSEIIMVTITYCFTLTLLHIDTYMITISLPLLETRYAPILKRKQQPFPTDVLTIFVGQIPDVTLTYVPYDPNADPSACGR